MRVLLADDHKAMLYHVARMLEPEFEGVGTVTDGQALLEAAARLAPDVLVLDISMPSLSGLQVARELKKAGSPAKIFLTVHVESDFVRESFASGGSAYVTKPRLATDLVFAIQEVVLAGRSFVSPSLSVNDSS